MLYPVYCQTWTIAMAGIAKAVEVSQFGPVMPKIARNALMAPLRGSKSHVQTRPITTGVAIHGTPDDIPLTAGLLERESRAAGLAPEVVAVTYGWRRLPPALQRTLWRLDDRIGERPRAARFGHTLMLMARR